MDTANLNNYPGKLVMLENSINPDFEITIQETKSLEETSPNPYEIIEKFFNLLEIIYKYLDGEFASDNELIQLAEKEFINLQSEQKKSIDEKLLATNEEIEFLQELVESQKQYLYYQQQELQKLEQELIMTNHELGLALAPPLASFEEAKALARRICQNEILATKPLAELLCAIYGQEVKPQELQPLGFSETKAKRLQKNVPPSILATSQKLRKDLKELYTQYKNLGYQSVSFQALFTQNKEI